MWIICALLAAVTAGVSVVLQKKGTVAGYVYRTSAVNSLAMLAAVLAVAICSGSTGQITEMTPACWGLTLLSGIVQTASWLFYFLAIKDANVSFLMVLDKTNIIVTMLLAWLLVGEHITGWMMLGTVLILLGTFLMSDLKGGAQGLLRRENRWVLWGVLSPALQAVANILAKLDTSPISPVLTTAIRLLIVAVLLCAVSRWQEGPLQTIAAIGRIRLVFLIAGGVVLGFSYALMYQAIADGIAAVVTPIVRSGFLVSTVLANIWLKERLNTRGWIGFAVVFAGVLLFLL